MTGALSNPGNTSSGAEDIDQPFARRRNMGQQNTGGATRADVVAAHLAKATTVREMGDAAVELGVPRGYADKILARECRNQIKVMELSKAARKFYRWAQENKHKAAKKRVCTRVTKRVFRSR